MSIEELGSMGVLHDCAKPDMLLPLEEEGDGHDEVACSTTPLTTVLLPREFKHSSTPYNYCDLHVTYIERNCSRCQKMKKIVARMLLDRWNGCKKKVERRSST